MLKLNQWMHTHSPKKPEKFKETNPCEKSGGRCFLGQEKITDGCVHATRDQSSTRNVMQNFRNLHQAIQNKNVLCLHDNAHLNTAAHTQALLEHFNWELFDHRPCSLYLILSDCHLFTYLRNWFRSQQRQ
jgi:hypothetical protein